MAQRYSKDFKHSMVRFVIDDHMTPAEVCHKHQLAKSCLYTWLQQWQQQSATPEGAVFQSATSYRSRPAWTEWLPVKEGAAATGDQATTEMHLWSLETRIADLERLYGQLTLENTLLKRALTTTQQRPAS